MGFDKAAVVPYLLDGMQRTLNIKHYIMIIFDRVNDDFV